MRYYLMQAPCAETALHGPRRGTSTPTTGLAAGSDEVREVVGGRPARGAETARTHAPAVEPFVRAAPIPRATVEHEGEAW